MKFVRCVAIPADAGPHCYAAKIQGDCLYPEYQDGDIVICDPDQTPGRGDFVVVKWLDGSGSIKQLAAALPPADIRGSSKDVVAQIVCRQFNPPKMLYTSFNVVQGIHKVICKAA